MARPPQDTSLSWEENISRGNTCGGVSINRRKSSNLWLDYFLLGLSIVQPWPAWQRPTNVYYAVLLSKPIQCEILWISTTNLDSYARKSVETSGARGNQIALARGRSSV